MKNAQVQFAYDYKHWDHTETITLRGSQSLEIHYAKRHETKRGRVPLASESILGDLTNWHIPSALLDGVELQVGDRIYLASEADIDSTTPVWIIHEASSVRFGTEWIATSTRFGSALLRHKVDITNPTITKDDETGGAKESFEVIQHQVPCWVRPATAQESTAWFQEDSVAGYLVYFDHDPEVDTENAFIFGNRTLAVQGYAKNSDGLDVIWIVPCVG